MDLDKGKFQFAGLKFLFEMELTDDPQLINHLKLNILDVSSTIRDVELLSSYNHRKMLIYVDVNWLGRKFFMKKIEAGILDRVTQLLPKFKFRVTADRSILDMSLAKIESVLKGDPNENSKRTASNVVDPDAGKPLAVDAEGRIAVAAELSQEPGVLQDPQAKADDK